MELLPWSCVPFSVPTPFDPTLPYRTRGHTWQSPQPSFRISSFFSQSITGKCVVLLHMTNTQLTPLGTHYVSLTALELVCRLWEKFSHTSSLSGVPVMSSAIEISKCLHSVFILKPQQTSNNGLVPGSHWEALFWTLLWVLGPWNYQPKSCQACFQVFHGPLLLIHSPG